ncbi:peptidase M50 [Pseudooceanicola nanhaiensis]|uniref:peptidase M50 n=1 Tax=Pseudooceanicola nanhaiensis TaxID=375761 RepID=UPI001CD61CE7|nr:peptidase M50 [Pseudooceanicola nanhaiensis]MCA0921684.1 peptidase M50 [Pseudooceanicola nanhaiensis]
MAQSVFSPLWFRVAPMRPRLRSHARIYRQVLRGGTWYVVQDDQTGRYHRLAPAANHMVSLMDGRRTMQDIWERAVAWAGEEGDPPTQDEALRLLAQLHHADLLAGDLPPDIDEIAFRAETSEARNLVSRLRNPLALRLPLLDPDRFLSATMPLVRPAFTWFGAVIWLAVVLTGVVLAALNWGPLTADLADRVFLAQNLLLIALVYPVIKALHELGHGYAVKNWGGEVHEMGLMFLVLIPVPYVDASASAGFPSKWHRAVVGGAGILVELFVAGLAMIFWAAAEPGLARAAAFNAVLIGSVSTLLFNGNPLLRFDGYYVLADLLEIPNLGQRANRHFFHVIKRYAFGMKASFSPATARGERTWFLLYAVGAFLYRLSIMVGIAVFIASKLFFLGVALALWAVANALVFPVLKGLWWLIEAPELRRQRPRALAVSGMGVAALVAGALLLPLPYATRVEGVIDLPEGAALRTGTEGYLAELAVTGEVPAGAQVLRLENAALLARRDLLAAQRAEIALRLEREILRDRAAGQILREQLDHANAALTRIEQEVAALTLVTPAAGHLLLPGARDRSQGYLGRGALVGYLVRPGDAMIRTMVPEARADLVRRRLEGVEVRLVNAPGQSLPAQVIRHVPKARRDLPSIALGTEGGGQIVLDPTAGNASTALDAYLEFDLAVPLPPKALLLGQRVEVRFDHGREPLAYRMSRALRQLFLRQFDV